MSYELLESDLTDSTLWTRNPTTCKLAVTIISKCHGSDRVYTPKKRLIELSRLTAEEGARAFAELMAPDPESRCTLEDGRFLVEKIDEHGNRYLWLPSYKGRRLKYLARERQRAFRERKAEEEARNVTQRHAESRGETPSHEPSPVEQNRTEQNRTEKKEKEVGVALQEALRPATLSGPIFETAGKESTWQAEADFVDELRRVYPNVDVDREMLLAAGKIHNGVVTKKTAGKGMRKFLYSWMAREQNSARPGTGGNGRENKLPDGQPPRRIKSLAELE